MNQLEAFLNSLIKMGWKPWGKDVDKITIPPKEEFDEDRYLFVDVMFPSGFSRFYTQRELVSINSGLWQFVVDKRIFDKNTGLWTDHFMGVEYDNYCYEYRLIESAFVPEEELVEFLVDNIKIEGNSK